jgi:hypothetical protein
MLQSTVAQCPFFQTAMPCFLTRTAKPTNQLQPHEKPAPSRSIIRHGDARDITPSNNPIDFRTSSSFIALLHASSQSHSPLVTLTARYVATSSTQQPPKPPPHPPSVPPVHTPPTARLERTDSICFAHQTPFPLRCDSRPMHQRDARERRVHPRLEDRIPTRVVAE